MRYLSGACVVVVTCHLRVLAKAEQVLVDNGVKDVMTLQHIAFDDLVLPGQHSAGLRGVLRAAIRALEELREATNERKRKDSAAASGSQATNLETVLDRVLNTNKSYVLVDQEARYKGVTGSLFTFVPEKLWPPHMAVGVMSLSQCGCACAYACVRCESSRQLCSA